MHNDEESVFKLSSNEEQYIWNTVMYHKDFDWNKLSPTNKSYYISYGVKPK
ncbi:hypothetical protein [Cellulosilyticum ruminicola]|uniref:hypothetical protein n=1 Tax=Cellulosilyticum ruminicola TaxID=425254 RepID=UPI0012ED9ED5|nr:hypothetical protein [Cellulosilyticum ruminicola]